MKTSKAALERRIHLIRGKRVMLDSDLAEVYGVPTKRLNQQVRRNLGRFPDDFMFRLTRKEADSTACSRSPNAALKRGENIKHLPHAFTEHGAVMLASVLNTPVAVKASVRVVRAFLWMRQALAAQDDLRRRVDHHDELLIAHDADLRRLAGALKAFSGRPKPPRRIGFAPDS